MQAIARALTIYPTRYVVSATVLWEERYFGRWSPGFEGRAAGRGGWPRIDAEERAQGACYAKPVQIGNRVGVGAGSTSIRTSRSETEPSRVRQRGDQRHFRECPGGWRAAQGHPGDYGGRSHRLPALRAATPCLRTMRPDSDRPDRGRSVRAAPRGPCARRLNHQASATPPSARRLPGCSGDPGALSRTRSTVGRGGSSKSAEPPCGGRGRCRQGPGRRRG